MKARQTITHLPIEVLTAHSGNIRSSGLGDVDELALSIIEHGILQPLTVTEHPTAADQYLILAGHRRLAAALRAKILTIPVIIRHDLSDEAEHLVVMLVENCQRRDLNAVEKAEAYGALRNRGLTAVDIGRRVGVSSSAVSYHLSLLDLDDASLEQVRRGQILVGDAISAVTAVRRQTRAQTGRRDRGRPAVVDKPHLAGGHPLAVHVRQRCSHTTRPKVGKVGCGECWEETIRDDALGRAQPDADGTGRDYDEAAVLRALGGDRSVKLRTVDRVEIVRRARARGWSYNDIETITPVNKPERYLDRGDAA